MTKINAGASAAAREACDEHHGASQRAPMDHPSRKVNYDVRGLDTTLSGVLNTLDKLVSVIEGPVAAGYSQDFDPPTEREVYVLRQYLRQVHAQVVYVIEANSEWSYRAAHKGCDHA